MYVDVKAGVMMSIGGVDEELHLAVMQALQELTYSKQKTVIFHFSSEGGDDEQAFAIYDLIRNYHKPVDIIISGPCKSAATLILQAARTRIASKHSTFLLHYGVPEYECIQHTEFAKILDRMWISILAERSNGVHTFDSMDTVHRTETYWTAQEAYDNGLLDIVRD